MPSCWLLDPTGPGRIEVLRLSADGSYRTVAEVSGEQALAVDEPFTVTITPAELLAGLQPR